METDKDTSLKEVFSDSISWDGQYDDPEAWMGAVRHLLKSASDCLAHTRSICVSGTSASCLMINRSGQQVTRKPRMYNYDIMASSSTEATKAAERAVELLDKHAPPRHTARAKTGSLAKLVSWALEEPLQEGEKLCHQADYVSMKLMESSEPISISSDWHNCLKCGYDVRALMWPQWLKQCLEDAGVDDPMGVVPTTVVSPGAPIGTISPAIAQDFGLPADTVLVGGTTDSNAAFLAAVGGTRLEAGTAVTSLGSTLAIKQLSSAFVEDASKGVYSHRFPSETGEQWLVGGASNVGCAVLREEGFSNEELVELSNQIDPSSDSPLEYYPLVKKGERFPVADSNKEPQLQPMPSSRSEYLHGILQGISHVERDGFAALGELGAVPETPAIVWTCGGGSKNEVWTEMRRRKLSEKFEQDIDVQRALNTEASYGAALLAASRYLPANQSS